MLNGEEMDLLRRADEIGVKVLHFDDFSINLSFMSSANKVGTSAPQLRPGEKYVEIDDAQREKNLAALAEIRKKLFNRGK